MFENANLDDPQGRSSEQGPHGAHGKQSTAKLVALPGHEGGWQCASNRVALFAPHDLLIIDLALTGANFYEQGSPRRKQKDARPLLGA